MNLDVMLKGVESLDCMSKGSKEDLGIKWAMDAHEAEDDDPEYGTDLSDVYLVSDDVEVSVKELLTYPGSLISKVREGKVTVTNEVVNAIRMCNLVEIWQEYYTVYLEYPMGMELIVK